MPQHCATVRWHCRDGERFLDNQYSRRHSWHFDGGLVVPASASPHIVPLPYAAAENVDPEEAFVAALSSCHMLFFLAFAAKRGLDVEGYDDEAVGVLTKPVSGKLRMVQVTLRPKVTFVGEARFARDVIEQLHSQSHEACFIANSVNSEVIVDLSRQP